MSEETPFGRYVLTERLGAGGMAEVYLAYNADRSVFSEPVVIKRLLPHLKSNRHFVEMFLREARVVAQFNHPNIVRILDLGRVGEDYFIAMEHVDGLTVDGLGRRFFARGQPFPLDLAAQIIADAALGLDQVHSASGQDGMNPIVHRDISPDNLMMNSAAVTKILDFGIARPELGDHLTQTGVIKGKIPFMPPEQVDAQKLDGRTDLYALGVSLFWLLTERRPFDRGATLETMAAIMRDPAPRPSAFREDLPRAFDEIVLTLLAKDPDDRFQTGRAVAQHLEPLIHTPREELARIVGEMRALPEPPRRRPMLVDPGAIATRTVRKEDPDAPLSSVFGTPTQLTPSGALGDGSLAVGAAAVVVPITVVTPSAGTALPATPVTPVSPSAPTRTSMGPLIVDEPVAVLPLHDDVVRAPPRRFLAMAVGGLFAVLLVGGASLLALAPSSSSDAPGVLALPADPPPLAPRAEVVPVADEAARADAPPTPGTDTTAGREGAATDDDDVEDDDGAVAGGDDDGLRRTKRAGRSKRGERGVAEAKVADAKAADTKTRVTEPPAAAVEPAVATTTPEPTRKITVKAPASVRFRTAAGKALAVKKGTLEVPPGTRTVVAWDTNRDVKTIVPVDDDDLDYGALPRGELAIRAVPYATVFLGKDEVGTTPLPPQRLVAGTYRVRLVYEGTEKTRTIEVLPGDLTQVSENMTK